MSEQGWVSHCADGSESLDGSGVKILRIKNQMGEPDVIECDGLRYLPERTCKVEFPDDMRMCSVCHFYINENSLYCSHCGSKVVVS